MPTSPNSLMTTADPSPEYWLEYGPFQHAKHRLIKHYLDGWFPKLGTWAGRVLYIDTHAGRGRYSSGELGSPLVALNTLLRHPYRETLLKKSEVRFFFIERDPDNLESLKSELTQNRDRSARIHVDTSAGDAYAVLSSVIQRLRESGSSMAPAFIFVDPYGFKVPGKLLEQLMAVGRVELFVNVIWRELDMAIQQRKPPGHGMATALNGIFGDDRWRTIDGETPDERIGQAMHLLSNVVGAKWQTHFRMTTGGSATRYVLLHLTNHDAGRDLMKECMWRTAPGGDFEIRQCDDPKQPFLIAPEPDLAPLRRWVLERLQNGTYDKDELQTELRSEPWLVTHLNKVMKLLLRDGAIDRASGAFSLTDSPRLPGLNGGAD